MGLGLTGRRWRRLQNSNDSFVRCQSNFADGEGHFFRSVLFGSARREQEEPGYILARNLANMLAKEGIDIVTGGGPGIMEAANRGALEAAVNGNQKNGRSIGVPLRLPLEQTGNSYLSSEFFTEDFPFRLQVFGCLSLLNICIDGGVGTALEALWVTQHSQIQTQMGMGGVRRHLFPLHPSVATGYIPKLLLVGEGFNWFFQMLEEMNARGTAPSSELNFVLSAKDEHEAFQIAQQERINWRNHLASKHIKPRN
jgi:predicted Rossmann-fold nucleotide-binding protein